MSNKVKIILVCVGLVVIYFGIFVYKINQANPAGVFSAADNDQRKSNVMQIKSALEQYWKDHGNPPGNITQDPIEICASNANSCGVFVDLSSLTSGNYFAMLPVDPACSTGQCGNSTGYRTWIVNGVIHVDAPHAVNEHIETAP